MGGQRATTRVPEQMSGLSGFEQVRSLTSVLAFPCSSSVSVSTSLASFFTVTHQAWSAGLERKWHYTNNAKLGSGATVKVASTLVCRLWLQNWCVYLVASFSI
jgi:hypothetical protein